MLSPREDSNLHTPGVAASDEDWPPPYLLRGDSWCLPGMVRTRRVLDEFPHLQPATFLGWSPVVLQANHYRQAQSVSAPERGTVTYAELSVTACQSGRTWSLLPLRLLVDVPIARDLGEPYGFPKLVDPALHVQSGGWTLTAFASEGRRLTAVRGLGAFLLWGIRAMLAYRRLSTHLPLKPIKTTLAFRRVGRVAPIVGLPSTALRMWCYHALLFPIGVVVQDFEFMLEEPSEI
jgi:hypothetical protein